MSDILFDREIQSVQGAREFGRADGSLVQNAELVHCSLMKMVGPDGRPNGRLGVAKQGGRFVCPLPAGYDHNVGVLPTDGRLLVTRPGMPTLVADCETGTVRQA